jgi:histidinol-phosphate aminotransferase
VRHACDKIDVREYPLGALRELSAAASQYLRLPTESIIPTEGADQGIDLICQAFLREGDKAVIVGPTYSFYRLRSSLARARCVEISLNENFSLPIERILSEADTGAAIFLCSPNNPTGNQFPVDQILHLCDNFPGLVVLDEAYVDFATDSVAKEIMRRQNLVILRTFSKAFGLADLRLGLVIANPSWSPIFLDRVQYPYPISGVTAAIAICLMKENGIVKNGVESLKRERSWLLQQLGELEGVQAFPSQANFVLANLPMDYAGAHQGLLERGIATKRIGRILNLPNCIRVTVGTREMNRAFLEALTEVLGRVE